MIKECAYINFSRAVTMLRRGVRVKVFKAREIEQVLAKWQKLPERTGKTVRGIKQNVVFAHE
jgi:hypothetical protein